MMLSKKAIGDVAEVLEPQAEKKFSRRSHSVLYRAIRKIDSEGGLVDAVTVRAFLEAHKRLNDVGGEERIREIATLVPASSNAAHHAKIVREAWAKREVADALPPQ